MAVVGIKLKLVFGCQNLKRPLSRVYAYVRTIFDVDLFFLGFLFMNLNKIRHYKR